MRFFLSLLLTFLLNLSCMARELYKEDSCTVFDILSQLETQAYGKIYTQDDIYNRLNRLENTFYNKKFYDTFQKRVDRLRQKLSLNRKEHSKQDMQAILEMLESRYLGASYTEETSENRISRLEKVIFGEVSRGDIECRYSELIKKVPLSITGVSVTDKKGKTTVIPEIKIQHNQ